MTLHDLEPQKEGFWRIFPTHILKVNCSEMASDRPNAGVRELEVPQTQVWGPYNREVWGGAPSGIHGQSF